MAATEGETLQVGKLKVLAECWEVIVATKEENAFQRGRVAEK